MPRLFAHLIAFSVLCASTVPAFAGGETLPFILARDNASGDNIFSVPEEAGTVPSFTQSKSDARKNRVQKMLLGDGKDGIPNFRQVMNLPTLSPQQRNAVRRAFKAHKAQADEVVNKLKAMKERHDTAGGAAGMQDRQEFMRLRTQIQEMRKRAWEDVKAQLTEQQIKDIESMRKGELQPATFREGNPMPMRGEMPNERQ
jgi:hypothetical protein